MKKLSQLLKKAASSTSCPLMKSDKDPNPRSSINYSVATDLLPCWFAF